MLVQGGYAFLCFWPAERKILAKNYLSYCIGSIGASKMQPNKSRLAAPAGVEPGQKRMSAFFQVPAKQQRADEPSTPAERSETSTSTGDASMSGGRGTMDSSAVQQATSTATSNRDEHRDEHRGERRGEHGNRELDIWHRRG